LIALQAKALKEIEVSPRFLASVPRKIVSMSIALGPVAKVMTRGLYTQINSCQSWYNTLAITENAKSDLQVWLKEIQ